MAIERIGYRRLYDAVGCSLSERVELRVDFSAGSDLHAEVYLGPRPRFGIAVYQPSDKYIVPGEASVVLQVKFEKDATKSSYPRHFFTEIFCCKEVNIADHVAEAFRANDPAAVGYLLGLAEQNREPLLKFADLIAGVIGLRFHRQFVIELINEQPVVPRTEDDHVSRDTGPVLECLDDIALNERGVQFWQSLVPTLGGSSEDAREFGALVLSWLMRAWAERDSISQFFSLFVTLETVLGNYSGERLDHTAGLADQLRRLVRTYGGEQRKSMLQFLNQLVEQQRPSLNSRFAAVAQEWGRPGWKTDVAAFKRFNTMRNALLHKGHRRIEMQVTVEAEVRELQDLVERYVSYALFEDGVVYPSRWLRRPNQTGDRGEKIDWR